MKALYLILLFSLLPQSVFALNYSSYSMRPAPLDLAVNLNQFFYENGFHALAAPKEGLPSMGLNQVYFKTENQFVLVKYAIEGTAPLDEILKTPKGFMVHKKEKGQVYMLYFRGFNREYVTNILDRLPKKVTHLFRMKDFFLPSAYAAEDCSNATGQAILGQSSPFEGISAATAWESLKTCMSGVGEGVMDSTVGVVKSVGNELGEFFTDPVDYVEKVADKVELFLVKTAKFIKGLVTDPQQTLNGVGRGLGKAWESVKNTVLNMSTEMKINFVCSFIGSIGVDAALIFFTGGAASEKIILTINNLQRKFGLVGKLISSMGKLTTSALSKFKLEGAKLEKFMKGLFNNHFPEHDLKHLDDLVHVNDELSLRTLSCYIH